MNILEAGPHEIEWRRAFEEFFKGHEHVWNPATGLCIAEDCPSDVETADD